MPLIAVLQEVNNNDAGDATASTWHKRLINTAQYNSIGLSVSNGNITLPAGVYHIRGSSPAYSVNYHVIRLADSTNTTIYVNTATNGWSSTTATIERSTIESVITFAATTTIALWHWTENAKQGNGLGFGGRVGATGANYVYAQLTLTKFA